MGNEASGMGHRAWGMGHGASSKWALVIILSPFPFPHCPLPIAHCPLPNAQCPNLLVKGNLRLDANSAKV
ncbi:hypothetical protein [Tolypothrix sp. VBCCA 56010]|uniref:hypothetical protein n=1 Tax=Tolypothrix sp. VBCCA 56010 TaxID=3137731 RepID=UPI003D7D7C9B